MADNRNQGSVIYPGLDISGLSDDELQNKITDLGSRLSFAHSSWANGHVIEQLTNLQSILNLEKYERLAREADAAKLADKKIIETEPDLKEKIDKKEQQVAKRDTKKRINMPIITKQWVKDKEP